MKTNGKDQTTEEKLKALRDAYRKHLPGKINEGNMLWTTLNSGDWDPSLAKDFRRYVHTLAGSAPTFGFVDVGQNAREIEVIVKQCLAENKQPSTEECDKVSSILAKLASDTAT